MPTNLTAATPNSANQALLDSIRRLNAGEHLVGDQICVIHATFGIDVLASGYAPGAELIRVYVNTDNPDTFCLHALAAYLGIAQPLVESAMEFVTVLKYGHLPLVPSHADCLNLLVHMTTPCVETQTGTLPD